MLWWGWGQNSMELQARMFGYEICSISTVSTSGLSRTRSRQVGKGAGKKQTHLMWLLLCRSESHIRAFPFEKEENASAYMESFSRLKAEHGGGCCSFLRSFLRLHSSAKAAREDLK